MSDVDRLIAESIAGKLKLVVLSTAPQLTCREKTIRFDNDELMVKVYCYINDNKGDTEDYIFHSTNIVVAVSWAGDKITYANVTIKARDMKTLVENTRRAQQIFQFFTRA